MPDKAKNFRFEVKNEADSNSEILIYGYIGKWEDVDYKGFRTSFQNILAKNKDVTIRIHSGGGSVYEGLAIYDLMRSSDANITVIVEGMAASMASAIALGGDVIKMTENAFFMMHPPSSGQWGDKTAMQSTVNQLEQCEKRLIEIYKERTTADESVILDWMKPNQDTWIDSENCLKMKICDEVIKPTKNRQHQAKMADMANKSPEEIFAAYEGETPNEIFNKNKQSMKNRIIQMLVAASITHTLTASSEDADFEKALEGVIAKAQRCEKAESDLKNFKAESAKNLIDSAVASGKIPASEKEQWLNDATDNYGMVERALAKIAGKPDINNELNKGGKENPEASNIEMMKGREAWNFDKWQSEDPKGLETLEDKHPAEFEKLFNAKFKK